MVVGSLIFILGTGAAHAQSFALRQLENFTLPAADQVRLLEERVAAATDASRPYDVLAALDYYRVTDAPESRIPAAALLAEVRAAAETHNTVRALAALKAYLDKAAPDDPERSAAAALLPEYAAKASAAEAAANLERETLEARRQQRLMAANLPAPIRKLVDDMVLIPGGVFLMGSQSKVRADTDEKPVHIVRVPAFRLEKFEVTYEQYDVFARMTRRSYPQDGGYGRDQFPVGNVSWEDAQAFVSWLATLTGLKFRLPSESEWEYVASARAKTDYPWGDTFQPDYANGPETGGRDTYYGPAPVGQFPANPFGVHDMIGNVWEWVQDCYRGDYVGAPADGSADDRPDCTNRIFRGGSYYSFTKYMRTSYRGAEGGTAGNITRGFRVAEDLAADTSASRAP